MSYRSLALAVAAFSSMHVASADAQSVYVAPGGVFGAKLGEKLRRRLRSILL
jgi:uncharacterized membrane protein YfcA